MAIDWGPWTTGHSQEFRVGIDWRVTNGDNITVEYWIDDEFGSTSDTQRLNKNGNWGGAEFVDFQNNGGATLITTSSFDASPGWSGSVGASVGNIYNGAVPIHSVTASVPSGVPDQIPRPTIVSVTDDSVRLNWERPSGNGATIDNYELDFDGPAGPGRVVLNDTSSFAVVDGFQPNELYDVAVRAHNSNGWGPFSAERNFTTDARQPGPPPAPTIDSVTDTEVVFSWSPPSDTGGLPIQEYKVILHDAAHNFLESGFSTNRAHRFTGLTPGDSYYVAVRARNAVGWGPYSNYTAFTTGLSVPGRPQNVTVSQVTPTGAHIDWDPPSFDGGASITGYEVQVADNSAFNSPDTYTPSSTALNVSGLVPSTTYWVRIAAINSQGQGDWSVTASFETMNGVWVGTGSAWQPAVVWVGDGTSWVQSIAHVGSGSQWRP